MKEKILQLLRKCDGYVSGQEICNELGVSRTAVWKNINSLKEEGYQIDSVNNKGYKLLTQPDLINEIRIREYLRTKWLGNSIVYLPEVNSTNVQAKKLGEDGAKNGTVIVTECQTDGRGRRGKNWFSPKGNCYFSILLRPDLLAKNASMITLVAALAVAETIKKIGNIDVDIKWPNDIVANGKKICGILTESSTDMEYINYVVIGIGINVNQTEFSDEIIDRASSVCLEAKKEINRAELVACFLESFESYYEKFLDTNDLSKLEKEYNSLLINRNREVRVIEGNQERILKAIGIDQYGKLIVEDEYGKKESILSGEVSVRGLYGYV